VSDVAISNAKFKNGNDIAPVSSRSRSVSAILIFLSLTFLTSCQVKATSSLDKKEIQIAKNDLALRQAKDNIEKHRKGDVRIRVINARGRVVQGLKLQIKQISHNFKFGCYLKIDDLAPEKLPAYERYFSKLFNYAVIGNYWDFVENKQGVADWTWFDREAALSRKLGARVQMAPILWGTNDAGTPKWLPRNKDALLPILKDRVRSSVIKSGDLIDELEVVNEPLAPKTDKFAERAGGDYIAAAFNWAREAAPNKRLLINEYGVFGSVAAHNYNRDKYFGLLEDLIKRQVPIDAIGIQAHANGEWYSPANVSEQLDRYASLGKPIQITEFSAQTLEYDDRKTPMQISGSYRNGVWNGEKQAEFYREFYTIAFGNRQVEAITTWGLDDERSWLPGIGLLDKDGKPKASYTTLDSLINKEWKTSFERSTDENGRLGFRGFYGNYEVLVRDGNGGTKPVTFVLEKGKANEWVVRLPV